MLIGTWSLLSASYLTDKCPNYWDSAQVHQICNLEKEKQIQDFENAKVSYVT